MISSLFKSGRDEIKKTKAIRGEIDDLIKEATVNHDPLWFRKKHLDEKTTECINREIEKCFDDDKKESG